MAPLQTSAARGGGCGWFMTHKIRAANFPLPFGFPSEWQGEIVVCWLARHIPRSFAGLVHFSITAGKPLQQTFLISIVLPGQPLSAPEVMPST